MRLPTLSLWQPWASLLAHGQKTIETRSWPYRGVLPTVLAVHAAKKWDKELERLSLSHPFFPALEACGLAKLVPNAADGENDEVLDLPFGAVVGVGVLAECRGTAELVGPLLTDKERAFGDYGPGRYGWKFRSLLPLAKPIPARGMQGVFAWEVPADHELAVATLITQLRD